MNGSSDTFDILETALRTIVIYAFALALVRVGSTRVMGKSSALDDVVAIMLGSVMSRGIDGTGPMTPTLVAGSMLIGIHWVLSWLAFSTDWLGGIVKGRRIKLVEDGEIQRKGMRQGHITRNDLEQAMRRTIGRTDPARVRRAYLERDGEISVIPHETEPRVVTVAIEKGVQTVRIELG